MKTTDTNLRLLFDLVRMTGAVKEFGDQMQRAAGSGAYEEMKNPDFARGMKAGVGLISKAFNK